MSETAEKLPRLSVPALDEILGVKFPVLDDGFIRVVDYMGSDAAVVQAARVSYGIGTKKISEDRGLIRYLLRHRHTTPFEMCEIKFHVRVPMDCWRQWIRHRTANVNEYSTRYSVAIDAAQHTAPDTWRKQATENRQGSSVSLIDAETGADLTRKEEELLKLSRALYEERLAKGVAREQARKDLPLSTYTEAYWKCDLHNLLHFIGLRMDPHAQSEIRDYATVLGEEIVKRWCPHAWEAYMDYHFNSEHFSRLEMDVLAALTAGKPEDAVAKAQAFGWLVRDDKGLKRHRERNEFEAKLSDLGMPAPWH